MTKRSGRRLLTLTAGAIMAMGILSPMASAATVAPGDHIPAPIAITECDVIPPDRDLAISNIVHDTALARQVTPKVMLAAFEAGWVESHMNNLDCGDKDSLGIFQQRPSQGWGTPEQIMDPVYATNAFLDQAIPSDVENPEFTAGQLAQSVQRSCCPERYDESQAKAEGMIAEAAATRAVD